ncbi:MAG: hypothetical protein K8I02_12450, partial [Candidatus Methylomirabilis sp.]|nr:hypothetical protein [Deltaproteobacteria bacterium]
MESVRALDVNRLHRTGCLAPGWQGGWEWRQGGVREAWITLESNRDRLVLTYRVRTPGEEWQDVRESVPIARVPCRFGGTRPYFLCPGAWNGAVCGRRAVKLYGAGRFFLCRRC